MAGPSQVPEGTEDLDRRAQIEFLVGFECPASPCNGTLHEGRRASRPAVVCSVCETPYFVFDE